MSIQQDFGLVASAISHADAHDALGRIGAEIERLRLTLATVAAFIEGEQIAHAIVVPEGKSVHDKDLLSLIGTINAALGRAYQQSAGAKEAP